MSIILASGSPRRIELLKDLGIEFQIRPTAIDEKAIESVHAGEPPERIALAVARGKLERITTKSDDLVMAADTLVTMDGSIFGKPEDSMAAMSMLNSLAGRDHRVTTGVVFQLNGICLERWMSSSVVVNAMTEDWISRYARSGEPLDKAGGYAIQGEGAALVKSVHGCFLTVVGLPLCVVAELLGQTGFL